MHLFVARLARKRQEPHAEHVQRRDPGRYQRKYEEKKMVLVFKSKRQRLRQDRILAVPAAKKWNAGDGEHAGEHRICGNGHFAAESAHLEHVLLMVAAVNYAAGAQE